MFEMDINISLDKCTRLNNTYTLYYHNPNENSWELSSYNEIISFNTLEEFWIINKFVSKDMVDNGMFFLMIDGILPIWEDVNNINGGNMSWKLDKKYAYKYWLDSIIYFITDNLLDDKNNININGISISPKKNSNIIKIWTKQDVIDLDSINMNKSFELNNIKPIYKANKLNIERDKAKYEK